MLQFRFGKQGLSRCRLLSAGRSRRQFIHRESAINPLRKSVADSTALSNSACACFHKGSAACNAACPSAVRLNMRDLRSFG